MFLDPNSSELTMNKLKWT